MPPHSEDTSLCHIALAIVVLPLIGFVVQIFAGRKLPPRRRQGDWLPTLCIFGSLGLSGYLLGRFLAAPHGVAAQRWRPDFGLSWIAAGESSPGGFRLDLSIAVDNLTIVMLFVVSAVSSLVHLYSWGYMRGEVRYARFFAYLALFSFAMLGLCATNNLLVLYIFWELVGFTSYLLIGFYFEKEAAQRACLKAFLTTRLGDVGFLAAILIIATKVGSLEFQDIFASVERGEWPRALLAATGLCLFAGAAGKSAQFPLHIWLPDAMEGPTPVSALIHAATMVAAGVYLIGRLFPFLAGAAYFEGAPLDSDVLFFVAAIGGFSAFFAATIAPVQGDLKRVLAYSTISQLGYMMLALGSGSVTAGLFHLTTHAFFKALLFLAAGSVIHAVGSNEIREMGGLGRKMPLTRATFLAGTLALCGFPLFSGFYSKEAVLSAALHSAQARGSVWGWLPFAFGIAAAGLTPLYMFRAYFLVFQGQPRNPEAYRRAHESPRAMTIPMCALALLAVISGGFFVPGFEAGWFEARVSSALLVPVTSAGADAHSAAQHSGSLAVLAASLAMLAGGAAAAGLFFAPRAPFARASLEKAPRAVRAIHKFLSELWYVDALLVGAALGIARRLARFAEFSERRVIDAFVNAWGALCQRVTAAVGVADAQGVDGTVRAVGEVSLWLGARARRIQSGILPRYVTASLLVLFALVALCAASLAVARVWSF